MPLLSTKNLSRAYFTKHGPVEVVRDVTIQIQKGETVAIIGKSGSGKSTLMHLLALLDRPTAGDIFIDERSASALDEQNINRLRNRRFGFIFQQFFLNGTATVLENVMLPLIIAGVPQRERQQRARDVLAAVELSDKAGERAVDLSGGQKQRVCIARALITKPDILFADEPTGNLDSTTGRVVMDVLFGLNKSTGVTLVLVTHDRELARQCDRTIEIRDGAVITSEEDVV